MIVIANARAKLGGGFGGLTQFFGQTHRAIARALKIFANAGHDQKRAAQSRHELRRGFDVFIRNRIERSVRSGTFEARIIEHFFQIFGAVAEVSGELNGVVTDFGDAFERARHVCGRVRAQ